MSVFRAQAMEKRKVGHRSKISDINIVVLLASVFLIAFGLLVIYSASLSIPEANFKRQCIGVGVGIVGALIVWNFDYRKLESVTTALLVIDIILMVAPLIPGLGVEAKGINGWIQVPLVGVTFQPAELAKLVTIFMMAGLAAQYNGKIVQLHDYIKLCLMLSVPFILILLQPDLGTGMIVLTVGAVIIIYGGPKKKWVLITLALLVGVVALVLIIDPILDQTIGDDNSILKDYQMNRLLVFMNHDLDPTGSGYNLQQSMIAVGSGGFSGKGFGNATQAGQGFLPEAQTDFVFALLSEEFGFLGAMILLTAYAVLIFASIRVARGSDSLFGKLIVVGVVTMWTFQILENVGMCIGMMPITGIPLPFISFGSSSMIVQLMAVGVVQSVYRHKTKAA